MKDGDYEVKTIEWQWIKCMDHVTVEMMSKCKNDIKILMMPLILKTSLIWPFQMLLNKLWGI